MQVVLYKVTARRTRMGLVTTKREVIGVTGDDPDVYLDRLARILARGLFNERNKKGVKKFNEQIQAGFKQKTVGL
ncbi:hypothetical protein [Desulfotruncus alcoholivorax]|uniref:hypothetical protein n=1 Tax=Desulfotruncus alcoholivorax TaxID=265477 RepID=UPI000408F516|nr:hypothetical protein [Desulfotruncus alcoholivorax]